MMMMMSAIFFLLLPPSLPVFIFLFPMDKIKIGSLNINGGRDQNKRELVSQMISDKKLDIIFLQETHSDINNEVDWGLWWRGHHTLSHGTNLSAGVATLVSPGLDITITSTSEIMAGRAVAVKAKIQGLRFCLLNVYASNVGLERLDLFQKVSDFVKQCSQDDCLVMGGDWNCTTDFALDRTGQEPHWRSAAALRQLGAEVGVVDAWRVKHPTDRQYTWVKVVDGGVSAARLDRVYISQSYSNRLLNSHIYPVGFADHHLVTLDFHITQTPKHSSHWHFNVKLLHDTGFCKKFEAFWEIWRGRKGEFESLSQWWEVGKAHIRVFCQQYTSHSTTQVRRTIQHLEQDIRDMEDRLHTHRSTDTHTLHQKRQELSTFLQERVKGALVRARFTTVRDMDAPTSFFFNLEKSVSRKKQMVCLHLPDGHTTTNPVEMRGHAVDLQWTFTAPFSERRTSTEGARMSCCGDFFS